MGVGPVGPDNSGRGKSARTARNLLFVGEVADRRRERVETISRQSCERVPKRRNLPRIVATVAHRRLVTSLATRRREIATACLNGAHVDVLGASFAELRPACGDFCDSGAT